MIKSQNKITKKIFTDAVRGSFGIMSNIARRIGCTRRAVYYFLEKTENKDLRILIEEEKELLMDLAENNLIKALKSKDKNERKWSTVFILNTQGANRGYGNKNENTNKNIDVALIMNELENSLPHSIVFIERIARGEDLNLVYPEFKYFMANHKIESIK